MAHWGYNDYDGPNTWGDKWPIAEDPRLGQSPIDLEVGEAERAEGWKRMKVKFRPLRCTRLHNNGHTFQVDVATPEPDLGEAGYTLKYGPLHDNFALAQFHFHWGKTDDEGSEHTVNGHSFAAEAHFVHYDMTRFSDANEAIDKLKGIAVLGVLFRVGAENRGVARLLEHFRKIKHAGMDVELEGGFNPRWLLPERKDRQKYWHYYGSLTTPPLHESVNWFVFQKPLEMSSEQLAEFRELHSGRALEEPDPRDEFNGRIQCNFRPTQRKNFMRKNDDGERDVVQRILYSERKKARPKQSQDPNFFADDSGEDADSADSVSSSESSSDEE